MVVALVLRADPWGLLVAFGAGIVSFVSPCVLPMVPGYLSMVSGLSAAQLGALRPDRSDPDEGIGAGRDIRTVLAPSREELRSERSMLLRGILLFIAGFTVIFTILGASASALGHLFITHKPLLTKLSGLLVVSFGALLVAISAGLRVPSVIQRERRLPVRPSVLGAWAPPIMGVAFAFAWTPCVSPVLGSVMTLAAGTGGSATNGITLLLAYSLGLGVPFLLFGVAFGRMTDLIARVRVSLRYVDLIGGSILIAFGLLLLTGNVSLISNHVSTWLTDLHINWLGDF